jgi:RNA polymerase sigma-70 factor (ECF subfamily)
MDLIKTLGRTVTASPERQAEADVDLEIVRRVQAGEVAAFDALVRKYRERIYSVVYHLTSNRDDAADMAQDAFIKAFQSINRFKGQSSFFTWLYRIAVNTTYTHLRKARLRSFFSLDDVKEGGEGVEWLKELSVEPSIGKAAYIKEIQEKLNEAFQKLSIKHRTVVTLFEIEGFSHTEIAEIVGCSEGTVRSRLHYAKQQLQSDLKAYLK